MEEIVFNRNKQEHVNVIGNKASPLISLESFLFAQRKFLSLDWSLVATDALQSGTAEASLITDGLHSPLHGLNLKSLQNQAQSNSPKKKEKKNEKATITSFL